MRGIPPSLSTSERIVLTQLTTGDLYGLELVKRSRGVLSKNAIYVLLGRMEEKGLVVVRNAPTPAGESGPPRRPYRIAPRGELALAAFTAALDVWKRG